MIEQLSAEEFITKISSSEVVTLTMDSQQVVSVITSDDITMYEGPDPVVLGYVTYMQFLGQIEEITGLRTLVRSYLQDRLR